MILQQEFRILLEGDGNINRVGCGDQGLEVIGFAWRLLMKVHD